MPGIARDVHLSVDAVWRIESAKMFEKITLLDAKASAAISKVEVGEPSR